MNLTQEKIERTCKESEVYNELLSMDGKQILELGCGTAEITRDIASEGKGRQILALEVDERQHQKNLQINDLPNVRFELAGAENIPAADESRDIVFMFKSLHHVPGDKLEQAMQEIKRVLKPGGMTYISEPVFSGDFNDLISLFNDEQEVRQAAFNALKKSVQNKDFILEKEVFFNVAVSFDDFEDFEDKVLNVTHTEHQLSEETYAQVKNRFQEKLTESGAHFIAPIRVDLLRKQE